MSSPTRPYLGESAEARVAARRARLVEAAFVRMASDGWRAATIDAVCREAKLNKRYFYESFADLEALSAAVVDEIANGLLRLSLATALGARARGASTHELARETLDVAVGYLLDDPRRAHVLFSEVAESPGAIAHRRATIHGLALALSAYGHDHHGASGTDPIAGVASALLIGGSIEVVQSFLAGTIGMSREQMVDDLAALWVVTGDGAAARARARVGAGASRVPPRGD